MDTEEVLLRGGGEGEGVPFQPGYGGALDQDVLPRRHFEVTLSHVKFQNSRWVAHHLNQSRESQVKGEDDGLGSTSGF